MADANSRHPKDPGPTVLVAVDFSPDSEAALVWAGRYADALSARLLILHVVHDPAASPGFYRKPEEDWIRPMFEVAEDMMRDFLQRMGATYPALKSVSASESKLVSGLPAGRIVEVADAEGVALIVIGSRGRTGLPHILLGSVAERVVQTASVPVVVVKRPAETVSE